MNQNENKTESPTFDELKKIAIAETYKALHGEFEDIFCLKAREIWVCSNCKSVILEGEDFLLNSFKGKYSKGKQIMFKISCMKCWKDHHGRPMSSSAIQEGKIKGWKGEFNDTK